MPDPHEVPARIRDLAAPLAQPKAMRRGSFSQRYVKCSKPGCACARDPKARHGPYSSLTRGLRGRTHSRFISAAQAELVRRQVEAGQTVPAPGGGLLGGLRAMGQCPARESGGGFRKRPKKGSKPPWETKVVEEVEALLGREAVAELDFEALALRQRTLGLAARAIGSVSAE